MNAVKFAVWFADSFIGNAVVVSLVGVVIGPIYPILMSLITKLFPHQKQALSFLLDREQDRSFDLPPAGEAQEVGSENGDAKGKGRAPQEEETVSLWKAVRKRDGTPRAYLNVVTNSESLRRPEV